MNVHDIEIPTLEGEPARLGDWAGQVLLLVNVASRCGLTPQYEGLQRLQDRYGERGFAVLGFPCNQFLGQEPGTPEEIREFCSTNYGVTFPLFTKIEVNGEGRHPLYARLVTHPDGGGYVGDVRWNFEKFVVDRHGEVIARFEPTVTPEDPALTEVIEQALTG